jgi:hemerythrin
MFFRWKSSMSIGVPEIDAEHRYLFALVNNLFDAFYTRRQQVDLVELFVHLTNYVDKHFRNEEMLMRAIDYPLLREHRNQHLELTDNLSALTEDYLGEDEVLDEKTLNFLKGWVLKHVLEEDKKIGRFMAETGKKAECSYEPAYVHEGEAGFQTCSYCGKKWETFDALVKDKTKKMIGFMADENNPLFNLILFNCSCHTTLGLQITQCIELAPHNFSFEERTGAQVKPDYCLQEDKSAPCLRRCACAYTNRIFRMLSGKCSN